MKVMHLIWPRLPAWDWLILARQQSRHRHGYDAQQEITSCIHGEMILSASRLIFRRDDTTYQLAKETLVHRRGTSTRVHPMHRKKINLAEVMKALDAVCPKCGRRIPPAEIRRVDFTSMRCPGCGEIFDAKRPLK